MHVGWFYLLLAGLFEVGFTTSLKMSDGFTRLWPSLSFLVCSILSFYLLNRAIHAAALPLGTAYAVWTGIGAVGTVLIGILFFKEPVTLARLLFLSLLIFALLGLRLVSGEPAAQPAATASTPPAQQDPSRSA